MSQSSILGTLLLNISLNDLFLLTTNSKLSNYTDDNTLYASDQKLEEIKQILYSDFGKVTKWFYENYMALNRSKCNFMCLEETLKKKHLFLKQNNEKQ